MSAQFDIEKILNDGKLINELDYERALIADRKLRLLAKKNADLKILRTQLRDIIELYENKNWSSASKIDSDKLREGDLAELIAEKERLFVQRRKLLIKQHLKRLEISQQDLGQLLGHTSKTYMSDLMNGISPFTLNDLIVINRLLKIKLLDLVPTTLSQKQRKRIRKSIKKIGTKRIKLSADDFDLVVA